MSEWDEAKLQQYIDNGIEESLTLDYKAADSLKKNPQDPKKDIVRDVSKDVSAMANSAGGLIIYGITELPSPSGKAYLPKDIDPLDRNVIVN